MPGATSIAQLPGDARLSAFGITSVATVGQQVDNTSVGELWVSYHIRLSRPVLETTTSAVAFSQHLSYASTTGGSLGSVSNNYTGSPFTMTSTAVTGTIDLVAPTGSPLIGSSFLVTMLSSTTSNGAFASTPAPAAIGGTTFPLMNRVLSGTAVAVNQGSHSDTVINTLNSYPYVTVMHINAAGDGIRLVVPYNSAAASYGEIFVAPLNPSLTGMRQTRVRRVTENSNDGLELELVKRQLSQLKTQLLEERIERIEADSKDEVADDDEPCEIEAGQTFGSADERTDVMCKFLVELLGPLDRDWETES